MKLGREHQYAQIPTRPRLYGTSRFRPKENQGYRPFEGQKYDIGYGDGFGSSGPVAREKVDIGGAVIPDMPIGVCSDLRYGSGASSWDTDGPVSLAFKHDNSSKRPILLPRPLFRSHPF